MRFSTLLFVFLAGWLGIFPALADSSKQLEITRATLLADTLAIEAGKPFKLGMLLEPKHNWHSYWENPGDAGLATEFTWQLPEGFTASAIEWPAPERINEGPLTIYGYHNTVFLPVTITPPATLDKSSYPISVTANWLICENICIPESATLEMTLLVGTPTASPEAERFLQSKQTAPRVIKEVFTASQEASHITLTVPLSTLAVSVPTAADFYVRNKNLLNHAAKPEFKITDGILKLRLESINPLPDKISGLLVVNDGGNKHYYDVSFSSSATPAESASPTPSQPPFLLWILLLAVAGGVILNLMPCVLPVLSLKALTLVKKGVGDAQMARHHGIAYTLGILLSFALLAGLLIGLQQAGEAVGWGYQMQSPVFVGVLIYLLFFVGLNLSGFFDLPVLLGNTGSKLTSETSTRGSFFTGMLATAVATPCTAPFMASAVGVALTLPAWQAMLVFESLGLGLALPFLLVSFFPALLRFLPKPGVWMEHFRQLLSFPMYASVLWLVWVLTLQTGTGGMVTMLSGMLVVLLVLWMKRLFSNHHAYRITALVLMGATIFITLQMIKHKDAMPNQTMIKAEKYEVNTVDYAPMVLAKLREEGKAVFVDATAAWCITCQVNARTAIHTEQVMMAFKEQHITLMIADWTRRNQEIKEFLNGFGYQGVPLYVYYPPRGEPVVLPQILTPNIILEIIEAQGEPS